MEFARFVTPHGLMLIRHWEKDLPLFRCGAIQVYLTYAIFSLFFLRPIGLLRNMWRKILAGVFKWMDFRRALEYCLPQRSSSREVDLLLGDIRYNNIERLNSLYGDYSISRLHSSWSEQQLFGLKPERARVIAAGCNNRLTSWWNDYSPSGINTTVMFKRIPLWVSVILQMIWGCSAS